MQCSLSWAQLYPPKRAWLAICFTFFSPLQSVHFPRFRSRLARILARCLCFFFRLSSAAQLANFPAVLAECFIGSHFGASG